MVIKHQLRQKMIDTDFTDNTDCIVLKKVYTFCIYLCQNSVLHLVTLRLNTNSGGVKNYLSVVISVICVNYWVGNLLINRQRRPWRW